MIFMTEDSRGKMTPAELKKKLEKRELSEAQLILGDIITENINEDGRYAVEEEEDDEAVKLPAETDRKGRRTGVRRALGLAAAAVFVIALGFGLASAPPLTQEVAADKTEERYHLEENSYTVEGEGYGSSGESADELGKVITSWDKVEKQKDLLPELLVPEYVPEGFEFVDLKLEWDVGELRTYRAEYYFENQDGRYIGWVQNNFTSEEDALKNVRKTGAVKEIAEDGEIIVYSYSLKETGTAASSAIKDMRKIFITGNVSEEEVRKILLNLK